MYGWSYVVKKLGNEITTNARAENVVEIVAIKRNTIMYGSIFCREITSIQYKQGYFVSDGNCFAVARKDGRDGWRDLIY